MRSMLKRAEADCPPDGWGLATKTCTTLAIFHAPAGGNEVGEAGGGVADEEDFPGVDEDAVGGDAVCAVSVPGCDSCEGMESWLYNIYQDWDALNIQQNCYKCT